MGPSAEKTPRSIFKHHSSDLVYDYLDAVLLLLTFRTSGYLELSCTTPR